MNVTDHETTSQNLVKDKLTEYTAITPLCRSSLLVELMNEMTELKQELDDQLGIIFCFLNFKIEIMYLLDFGMKNSKLSVSLSICIIYLVQ